jgi:hypothetical protein
MSSRPVARPRDLVEITRVAPPLSDDDRRVVEWLLENAAATLVLNGVQRDVRERILTALAILRGDHHPRPARRPRRRRPADAEKEPAA